MNFLGVHQTHCAYALTELINSAYRGTTGSGRWTSEHGLIAGERIGVGAVTDMILSGNVRVFAAFDDNDQPRCCIAVTLQNSCAVIGTFAVAPEEQGRGLGSQLLKHAEHYSLKHANILRVCVVNKNQTLIDFYSRRGYSLREQTEPYPLTELVGTPLVEGLALVVMEKSAVSLCEH